MTMQHTDTKRLDSSPLPKASELKTNVDSALAGIEGYSRDVLAKMIGKYNNGQQMTQQEQQVGGSFQNALYKGFGLNQKLDLRAKGLGQQQTVGVIIREGDTQVADVQKGIVKGALRTRHNGEAQYIASFEYNIDSGNLTITHGSATEPRTVKIQSASHLKDTLEMNSDLKRTEANRAYRDSLKLKK